MARKHATKAQRFELAGNTFSLDSKTKAAAFNDRKKGATKKAAKKAASEPVVLTPVPEVFLVFKHHKGMPHVQFPKFNEELGTRTRVVHITKIKLSSQYTRNGILISTASKVQYEAMHPSKKKLETHVVNTDLLIDLGKHAPINQFSVWFRCDLQYIYMGIGENAGVQSTKKNASPTAKLPEKGKTFSLGKISYGSGENAPQVEIYLQFP